MSNGTSQHRQTLYFAYGSNLSTTQMHQRCPNSVPLGLAHLPGYAWLINERGFANIVPVSSPGSSTRHPAGAGRQRRPANVAAEEQGGSKAGEGGEGGRRRPGARNDGGNDVENDDIPPVTPGVYGLLYSLPPADEAALDLCEGVPWAYEKTFLDVRPIAPPSALRNSLPAVAGLDLLTDLATSTVSALVYVDRRAVSPSAPRPEYVGRMNRGVAEAGAAWGLPERYVRDVLRVFIPGV